MGVAMWQCVLFLDLIYTSFGVSRWMSFLYLLNICELILYISVCNYRPTLLMRLNTGTKQRSSTSFQNCARRGQDRITMRSRKPREVPTVSNSSAGVSSRAVSGTSVRSDASTGTASSMASQKIIASAIEPNKEAAYEAILKIIILEYTNEPRFKTPLLKSSSNPSPSSSRSSSTLIVSQQPQSRDRSPAKNHHHWFHKAVDPELLPRDTIPLLKKSLGSIAVSNSSSIKDPLSKRCLLYFYNELLGPNIGQIDKAEELVVKFVGSATKQIQLYTRQSDIKVEVYKQTNVFVLIVIGILRPLKNSEISILKLEDYLKAAKPKTVTNETALQSNGISKPTYRLTEISSASLLGELFGVDKVRLQQDVIRLKDSATEASLFTDLYKSLSFLKSNEYVFTPDDFETTDAYIAWKKAQEQKIKSVINELPPVKASFNKNNSNNYTFLPDDPRGSFVMLYSSILNYESQKHSGSIVSNATNDLMQSCVRYWCLPPVSEACLKYHAAHLSILKSQDNELNVDETDTLFGILTRILGADIEPSCWSKVDKDLWISSLSLTYVQAMTSLRSLLSAIYGDKAPKFTPVLRILYANIVTDPLFNTIVDSGLPSKWIKRLRNTVLSTTEQKYVDILTLIPTDDTLEFIHVRDMSERIYKIIQQLQKKFPKPLLDEIYIANEAAYLFIRLFTEDTSNMLPHIEHYALKMHSKLDYASGLETYQDLKDIRNVFTQVCSKDEKLTFDLEKFFFKYLEELCSFTCKKILPIVKESLQHDKFEPTDSDHGMGYSSSVTDIFKMLNESLAMFRSIGWENEKQMALIYTSFSKSLSNAVVYYCSILMTYIIDDLNEVPLKEPTREQKEQNRKSAWLFNEMKAAVSVTKLPVPESYNFKTRTCVAINNLSQALKRLDELEVKIDPEKISSLANIKQDRSRLGMNLFTIRVLRCENIKPCGSDGLSSSSVVLVDAQHKKEIGKTKIVPKTLNPTFDEEFDIEVPENSAPSISITVWDHSSKFGSQDLCGRALLQLDPKKFRNDGSPEEITRDLDLQGSIVFEVSLESEKNDAIFSIGKANRYLTRTMERACSLMVEKFSQYITYSFSKQTLKMVCGSSGTRISTKDAVYDAISPLFDYLNSNLHVLANSLDHLLLLKVMLKAWSVVLSSADNLLLPALASVKVSSIPKSGGTWQNSFSNAVASATNSSNVPGFGRPLTNIEIDSVFAWLNALCYDFFHNDGAGPPLEELKDEHYQMLLLIPSYYDRDIAFLKAEVERLTPIVLKSIREKNFLGDAKSSSMQRSSTVARSHTVVAHGSAKKRAEATQAIHDSGADDSFQISTEDVILRILLAKDQREYVARRLREREKIAKSIATERLARMVVEGR